MKNTLKHDFRLDELHAAELNEFLQKTSDLELAEIIDDILKNHFGDLFPAFKSNYKKDLDRLRYRDALQQRIKILTKYPKALDKYIENKSKYELLLEAQPQIREFYNNWKLKQKKNSRKIGYPEKFFQVHRKELNNLISPAIITNEKIFKKLISSNTESFEKIEPQPPKRPEELSSPASFSINPSVHSLKSDSELLAGLGRPILEEILDIVLDIWDTTDTEDIDYLHVLLLFMVTHLCNSNTKGDGNSNRDTYPPSPSSANSFDRKSIAKTSGPSIKLLQKEYENLIFKLKDL